MQKYIKLITHSGTFHADEILGIATVFEFAGELPVERKLNITDDELENPAILVLDIGKKFDPRKGNFDHHQDGKIPATNMLLINHLCSDERLKALLCKQIYSSVDAIDRGIFSERPVSDFLVPDFNSLIRSQNLIDDGFEKALTIARLVLSAEIVKAVNSIRSEEIWNSLEKHDNIAIQHTSESLTGWREFAERDDILLLVSPNNRMTGTYQVMSRDTKILVIPETKEQEFRHNSGFLAVYSDYQKAYKYAAEIKNVYIYHKGNSL